MCFILNSIFDKMVGVCLGDELKKVCAVQKMFEMVFA